MNDDPKKLAEQYRPKPLKVIQPDRQLCMVRFSPCGKVLAGAGQDGTVRRWDAGNDQLAELPPLPGHGGWVQAVALDGAAQRLFAVDSWGGLRCWPYLDPEPKPVWGVPAAHSAWIRGLDRSPDGKQLATCGRDQRVLLWSAADGQRQQELLGHGEDVFAVAFHPDGKTLVSGDLKGNVKHWDLTTSRCIRDLDARVLHLVSRLQDVGGVRCLRFDPTGQTLACSGTSPSTGGNVQGVPTILFFDWATGKVRDTIKIGNEGDGFASDFHFHPAGFVMAVTSGNPGTGKLFFQRPADKEPFFQVSVPNAHSLSLHPQGKRLVVAATNANSNGNGRIVGKNKDYPGNVSPLHLWEMKGS